jgi:hypothetical protein
LALVLGITMVVTGCGAVVTQQPTPTAVDTASGSSPGPTLRSASPAALTAAAARDVMEQYMAALALGDFQVAWSLLAPGSRKWWSKEATFASERRAFMQSGANGRYVIGSLTHDRTELLKWVDPAVPDAPPLDSAYLAEVDFPALVGTTASFDMLVVARGPDNQPNVWTVR